MAEPFLDWYAILDIGPESDPTEILTAYRRASFRCHPDRNPEQPELAHERFLQLSRAVEVLLDDRRREAFDREWRRQHPNWVGVAHGGRHVQSQAIEGFQQLVREVENARRQSKQWAPRFDHEVEVVLTELARLHGAGRRTYRLRHWILTGLTILAILAGIVQAAITLSADGAADLPWLTVIIPPVACLVLLVTNAFAWKRYSKTVEAYRPTAERIVSARRDARHLI